MDLQVSDSSKHRIEFWRDDFSEHVRLAGLAFLINTSLLYYLGKKYFILRKSIKHFAISCFTCDLTG